MLYACELFRPSLQISVIITVTISFSFIHYIFIITKIISIQPVNNSLYKREINGTRYRTINIGKYSFQERTFTQNTALLISLLKAVNSPKHRELITIGNIAGRLLFRRNTSRAQYNFVMTILVFCAAFRRILFPFISTDAISPHTAYISLIDARPKPLELSCKYIRISLRVTLKFFPFP